MAKNSEVYKTVIARDKAFSEFCKSVKSCRDCSAFEQNHEHCCSFKWLELEASEKPVACLYCNSGKTHAISNNGVSFVRCEDCGAESPHCKTLDEAIAAYNKVAMKFTRTQK